MKKQIYALGTIISLDFSRKEEKQIMHEIVEYINRIDDEMSIYKEDSIVSNINKEAGKESVKVSKDVMLAIKKSIEYSKITNGFLDITTKPVTDIVKAGNIDVNLIKEKSKLINYKDIEINEVDSTVKLKHENMGIDLGCIAKGYVTDVIVDILNRYNVLDALIDLGGNIYAKGINGENKWNIGLQDPFEKRYSSIGYISLKDKSVVTSGNYERPNHIISPITGLPCNNSIASISIISDKSIDGEGLSTACFIMNLEDGIKLVESINEIDGIFITKDKMVYCTNNIKNKFVILNDEYKMIEINKMGVICE